jgi:hypothetical protein
METIKPSCIGYVTDAEVDEAACLVEARVREVLTSSQLRYLQDAIVDAVCAVQRLWHLGFISEDPEVTEIAARMA